MKDKMEMLDQWLKDICTGEGEETKYIRVNYDSSPVEGLTKADFKRKRSLDIFTDHNKYRITAIDRGRGRSYLGCTGSSRKPLAGEDWNRGSDLADGPFNKKTWNEILSDIVRYELVKLAPLVECSTDVSPKTSEDNFKSIV